MSKAISFKPGDIVMREGDRGGDGFYILESGSFEVLKQGVKIREVIIAGTIFGEMSDILGQPRSCTIVAKTPCTVTHITQGLDEVIQAYPDTAKELITSLARRLSSTTNQFTQTQFLIWKHSQDA
jgi:CRP-like cAMP-binding protein